MDSLLEKITLYDILSYLVPGVFMWILILLPLVCGSIPWQESDWILSAEGSFGTIILIGAVIIAYITGLILSEVSRWFIIWREKSCGNFQLPVDEAIIKQALQRSGLILSTDPLNNIKQESYFKIMYNDIQVDPDFKRIHNYKSAQILYKNLICAVLFSMIARMFMIITKAVAPCSSMYWAYEAACMGMAVTLWVRYRRFYKKVWEDTVIFFVKKYVRTP